jgi:hypothetical protein
MPRTEDSHVAKAAEVAGRQAADVIDQDDSALPEPLPMVPVRNESPALGTARCAALSTNNPVRPLLGHDPRRRRAVLLAVDADVFVASSLELAQAVQGLQTASDAFYLPKGVPVTITAKAAFWGALASSTSPSRISVLVEKDDE